VGDRPARRLARQTLASVVEARYEEVFELVRDELARSDYHDKIAAGVVLTGGSSKMDGVIELAEEMFHAPVRLGLPTGVSGLVDVVRNPIHSTGVGLLLFGRSTRHVHPAPLAGPGARKVLDRMREWFKGNF
jgi:Actin-like ATPase involved in cell division